LVEGLYELLNNGTWIGISLHAEEHKELLFARIRNFLKKPILETENLDHNTRGQWQFKDAVGKYICVWNNSLFYQSNIIEKPNGRFGLHQSNPDRAHENCAFRKHKNYHMIRGKIYKCGPVALMSEFDQQYPFDISEEDRALIHAPNRGLSIDEFDTCGQKFLDNIDQVIPQCKLCPESYELQPIVFTGLKPNKI
jgi:hypothetical protein